jgi:hypothetical protein
MSMQNEKPVLMDFPVRECGSRMDHVFQNNIFDELFITPAIKHLNLYAA